MNKKRATRKTPSSYKIPFKSEISAQGEDSKLMNNQKRKLSIDVMNDKEQTATIKNFKANKSQNQFKKLKCQKMKEQNERDMKYEDVDIDNSNSCNFSEIKINIESEKGSLLNTSFKSDENKVDNGLNSNDLSSVINTNGHICDDYDKIIVDVDLLINEIINNVCQKELKLTTFEQLEFEQELQNQKKSWQKNEDWSSIKDKKSKNQDMKGFQLDSSDKRKDNEKELRESNDLKDLKNLNHNSDDFKSQTEFTGFRIEEKGDFKRKNEHKQDEVNDSVLKNMKDKKQKMNNKGFISNYVNSNNDNFQKGNKSFDSLCTNKNENISSSEFKTDSSYVLENFTLKENQIIDYSSTNNKSFNLKSLKNVENISQQVLINKSEQFEENFTDFKTMPGSLNAQTSHKKTLTIPCMNALDYFKLTEMEGSDENSKLLSSSNELYHSNTVRLGAENAPGTQSEREFAKNENNTKHANENQTKDSTFHKAITCYEDTHENKNMNSNILLTPAEIETKSNLDKIEPNNICTSDMMNIVSSISNFKTENYKDINSSIFRDEEFIAEKIIFREKEDSDDNVIPTGVFQHLNEIFEYNTETTSVDLKCVLTTKSNGFISEEHATDLTKCNSSSEAIKTGIAMPLNNTKDSTAPINDLLKQDDLKFRKTIDLLHLNINEENVGKNIDLSNIAHENSLKLHKNEENINIRERNENFTIRVEIKDTEDATESITNKDGKCDEKPCFVERKPNEEIYFSDFDNCMEMDDDFDLTASQLSMLDANEKMESPLANKINAEQQTDITGSIYSNSAPLMMEIINELHSLRESIECLKEKLDKLSSRETKP